MFSYWLDSAKKYLSLFTITWVVDRWNRILGHRDHKDGIIENSSEPDAAS